MTDWSSYMLLWLVLCGIFVGAVVAFVIANLYIQRKLDSLMKELEELERRNR